METMIGRLLKFSLIGFLLQVGAFLIGQFTPQTYRDSVFFFYKPWFILGEYLFPSGAGGHAFPGGAMLGWLVSVVVYSVLIGTAIYFATAATSIKKNSRMLVLLLAGLVPVGG